jgi:hypothetical protein
MILPRPGLVLRSEMAPLGVRWWHRRLGRMVRPLLRSHLRARHDARMEHVGLLIQAVQKCNTRESLESLLGTPSYAMDGNAQKADVVEYYYKDGCMIGLCFMDGSMTSIFGTAHPTPWEVVISWD